MHESLNFSLTYLIHDCYLDVVHNSLLQNVTDIIKFFLLLSILIVCFHLIPHSYIPYFTHNTIWLQVRWNYHGMSTNSSMVSSMADYIYLIVAQKCIEGSSYSCSAHVIPAPSTPWIRCRFTIHTSNLSQSLSKAFESVCFSNNLCFQIDSRIVCLLGPVFAYIWSRPYQQIKKWPMIQRL